MPLARIFLILIRDEKASRADGLSPEAQEERELGNTCPRASSLSVAFFRQTFKGWERALPSDSTQPSPSVTMKV